MRRLLVLLCLISISARVRAGDWPQFRGPNCSGIATGVQSLPIHFSADQNVGWSHPLGDGIGSPVVSAGRVVISSMVDPETIGLHAFESQSGQLLWERTWPLGEASEIHKSNSQAATTPAVDDQRVYFYSPTLGLRAVDAATGADLWHQPLPVPYFVFKWGAGMSPVLSGDLVVFCQDDDLHPAVYAFDKISGELVWKDERLDMAVNYSHPVTCETPSGPEIVVAGTGLLIGYEPQSGKRLWHARTLLRNIKTTPVCQDGIIYISVQSGGIANQWLASVDRAETGNSDGRLTREEIQAFVGVQPVPEAFFQKTFGRGDLDGDGDLEGEELDIAFLHPDNFAGADHTAQNAADEFVMAVRAGGRGDVTDSHVLWKHPTKYTDHIVSPLITSNRMFLVKAGGIATCFETDKGKQLYGPVRIKNGSDYFASPVAADGKIFIAGENGHVVVLSDTNPVEVLAVNDMGDSILGTPAIADNALFIRTRHALLRIQH